jgi:uncharacterized protein
MSGIIEIDRLDVDRFPRGMVSRARLTLVRDGMGAPVQLPLLIARGAKPGPVFGITAALHGNELNGIPVIHRVFQRLDPKQIRGTIVAVVVVNVPAYLRHERVYIDGRDLNRTMPGRADGNVSEVYAFRVIDRIVQHFNFLLDLHTASFGRVNSLYVRADLRKETTARMAKMLRPQIILHNPANDRTMRGAAEELGIPAVTLEIGDPQRFQAEFIKRSRAGIRAVMAEVGVVPRRAHEPREEAIICRSSDWMFTDGGGVLTVFPKVTERVAAGTAIARLTNIFGDHRADYHAPHDCVVIGKSVNPVGHTGARVAHLGIEAEPGWQP